MSIALPPVQIRVLGALIEKQVLTPDNYPLSLAAVTAACNQKTSRDPVMSLPEDDVKEALDGLIGKSLARERSPAGSRVPKYSHRLDDSLGLRFRFSRQELGILCVLMLRGPQTPGELRTRASRLCDADGSGDIEQSLAALATGERGPYVRELRREPGRRENRYMHLLGNDEPADAFAAPVATPTAAAVTMPPPPPADDDRIDRLESALDALRAEVDALRSRLDQLTG